MSRRIGSWLLLACVALAGSARPAQAQQTASAFGTGDGPKQTINFTFGGISLKQLEDRDSDDVVVANFDFLDFDADALTSGTWIVGAEWLVPIGNYVEAGAGIATSGRREVTSFYRDYFEMGTEDDIEQELSLSVMPVSFTVRVVPFGQGSPVQPYVGAGLGLFRFRYVEDGEFIDFSLDPNEIFLDTYEATGWTSGPILLGGLRWAGETMTAGGEFRYHAATADLDTDLFVAPDLDLGGWIVQFTIGARF
jgi:hypothetical protein